MLSTSTSWYHPAPDLGLMIFGVLWCRCYNNLSNLNSEVFCFYISRLKILYIWKSLWLYKSENPIYFLIRTYFQDIFKYLVPTAGQKFKRSHLPRKCFFTREYFFKRHLLCASVFSKGIFALFVLIKRGKWKVKTHI